MSMLELFYTMVRYRATRKATLAAINNQRKARNPATGPLNTSRYDEVSGCKDVYPEKQCLLLETNFARTRHLGRDVKAQQ
jgi:hypothetical protein